jgi:chemotaxis protein histidine kinase CheA
MSDKSNQEARIFSVETRFQQMARRPGGVTREQAIQRAQSQIEASKPEFTAWLERELQDLSAAIRHLEHHSDDVSRLEDAYRQCCQLRDVGATMGFQLVSIIAGNLCEILDAIKGGASYHKETFDCHVDALLLTSKPPYSQLRAEQLPEMTAGLRRLVERSITPDSN